MKLKTNKRVTLFIFIVLILCASFFRVYLLSKNLFFGPEQGRDFLVLRDMVVNHKLTLIGAKTDIAGVFHGPLYYYIAAIPFALSHGNPVVVSFSLALLQVVGIPLIYFLTVELSKNKRAGLIAGTLYAVSFESIVYARWLSNPPLSLIFSVGLILCLARFLKGNHWYLLGVGILYGILGQLEFINYLLFGTIIIATFIRYFHVWRKTKWKILLTSTLLAMFMGFGTYILFDVRHGFLIFKSIIELLSGGGFRGSFFDAAAEMSIRYVTEIGRTFGIFHIAGATIITFVGLYSWLRYRKYNQLLDVLGIWMITPLAALYVFRHGVLEQVFVGLLPAWIIAVALVTGSIWEMYKKLGITVFAALVMYGAVIYFNFIPFNEQVFFQKSQSRIIYEEETQVVKAIYRRADGKPFYFQAFTIPVFWQDGWEYLFWYIGTNKYGYIPIEEDKSVIYVITPKIYWDPYLSLFKKNWYNETVSTWGKLTFEQTIGEFTIEERIK